MKKGWIKSIRKSKQLTFVAVTDGDRDFQLTLKEGDYAIQGELKVGASFIAQGEDSETPRGLYEFKVSELEIVGASDDEYPIQPKHHSSEFLRSIPELRGRAKALQATWKIRHHLTQAIHKYFDERGFYQYYTPIITDADCEGAGETFQVKSDWLDQHLTVSGQLHGEVGMMSLGKIYAFGPTFRAEKSATRKHLSEFWMIEPEMAWYDLDDTVDLAEDFVKSILDYVVGHCGYEFDQLGITTDHITKLLGQKWTRIKHQDFMETRDDVSSEQEKMIVEQKGGPVFITHYPQELKPFYMKMEDGFAKCFDLIFPEVGELIGGSQREEDYDLMVKQMKEGGLIPESMDWYLATRKWGTVPHSGFGIGFERLVAFICKSQKVHDVIPFPVSF